MLTETITFYKTLNPFGPRFSHLKKKQVGLGSSYHLTWIQMFINFWRYSLWYRVVVCVCHFPVVSQLQTYHYIPLLCDAHSWDSANYISLMPPGFQLDSLNRKHRRETARLFVFDPWTMLSCCTLLSNWFQSPASFKTPTSFSAL